MFVFCCAFVCTILCLFVQFCYCLFCMFAWTTLYNVGLLCGYNFAHGAGQVIECFLLCICLNSFVQLCLSFCTQSWTGHCTLKVWSMKLSAYYHLKLSTCPLCPDTHNCAQFIDCAQFDTGKVLVSTFQVQLLAIMGIIAYWLIRMLWTLLFNCSFYILGLQKDKSRWEIGEEAG